jgi:SAM-dependent methyltransferase
MKLASPQQTSRPGPLGAETGAAALAASGEVDERVPSHQNAVDLVKGWQTAFPADLKLTAGNVPLYNDQRVRWVIERLGDLRDRRILELGPLDGGHTSALVKTGALVDAIEANKSAFLRSLVSKEIYGHANLRLLLGDFVKGLEHSGEYYDLIFACGVLYEMSDPARLLRAMAERTRSIYLWTLCVTDDSREPFRLDTLAGRPVRIYRDAYQTRDGDGGVTSRAHYRLHRDDIVGALGALGFAEIEIAAEEPNAFGPVIGLLARKKDGSTGITSGSESTVSAVADIKFSRNEYKKQWNSVSNSVDDAKMAVSGYVDEDLYASTGKGTVEMLRRFVGIAPSDVFLEIGAGVGRVGAVLAPLCARWIGADVSENMIRHIQTRLAAYPNVSTVALSGYDLGNVASESVDVVYCTVVFMHLEEWDRYNYVAEAFRVLKPGGRLLVDNVNLLSDEGWRFFEDHRKINPIERPSQISKTSTPQELETYFKRAGFESIHQKFPSLWVITYGVKPLRPRSGS